MYRKQYIEELNTSLDGVLQRIEGARYPKLNPYTISVDLFRYIRSLRNQNVNARQVRINISDKIRKFHDYYGWKAKGTVNDLGLCSGTFFRTASYLSVSPDKRSGKKTDRKEPFGIHVEHSIPVNTIRNLLLDENIGISSPEDVFNCLNKYSVCVGFSRSDEKQYISQGFRNRHPDFRDDDTHPDPKLVRPFLRYKPELEIYSMLSGEKFDKSIDLETLKRQVMAELKGRDIAHIFQWEFICNNYNKK